MQNIVHHIGKIQLMMIFTKFDAVEIDPLDIKELFKIFISFYIFILYLEKDPT